MQQIYQSVTLPMEETMDLVRLFIDRDEIGSLSVEPYLSAQHDIASLETEHFTRPPVPRSALRLVLIGMNDAAIARHLGISERTARRYVGTLLETLGAGNRVTLAVTAVRDGRVG